MKQSQKQRKMTMTIVSYEQCIEDLNNHKESLQKVTKQIETIMTIADEYRFTLSAPQTFIDGLEREAKYHESKIELINKYISKNHGGV